MFTGESREVYSQVEESDSICEGAEAADRSCAAVWMDREPWRTMARRLLTRIGVTETVAAQLSAVPQHQRGLPSLLLTAVIAQTTRLNTLRAIFDAELDAAKVEAEVEHFRRLRRAVALTYLWEEEDRLWLAETQGFSLWPDEEDASTRSARFVRALDELAHLSPAETQTTENWMELRGLLGDPGFAEAVLERLSTAGRTPSGTTSGEPMQPTADLTQRRLLERAIAAQTRGETADSPVMRQIAVEWMAVWGPEGVDESKEEMEPTRKYIEKTGGSEFDRFWDLFTQILPEELRSHFRAQILLGQALREIEAN